MKTCNDCKKSKTGMCKKHTPPRVATDTLMTLAKQILNRFDLTHGVVYDPTS